MHPHIRRVHHTLVFPLCYSAPMKLRKMIAAFAFVFVFPAFGSSHSKNIHEDIDPYSGLKTLFLEVQTHTCPGDPSPAPHDPEVHLLFAATQRPDHGVAYYITPELDRGSALNLRHRQTMDTLIDGVVGSLTTKNGSTVVTSYDTRTHSYLHETIPFAVERALLETLSRANTFQFRVNGSRQSIQRCTDAKHLHDLPEFLDASLQY